MKHRVIRGLAILALAVGLAVVAGALGFVVLDRAPASPAPPGEVARGTRETVAELERKQRELERKYERQLGQLQREYDRQPQSGNGQLAEAYSQGKKIELPIVDSHLLALVVRKLANDAFRARPSMAPQAARGLQVTVRYAPPLLLQLPATAYPAAAWRTVTAVDKLTLVSTAEDEDGWPTLFASSDFAAWSMGPCKGPIVVEMLCLARLVPHLPATAAAKCAPRQHAGRSTAPARPAEQSAAAARGRTDRRAAR